MSKKKVDGPNRDSSSPKVQSDIRPRHAVALGFTGHFGNYLDINHCLVAFVNDIRENTCSALRIVADEMDKDFRNHVKYGLDHGAEEIEWWPNEVHRQQLRYLADQAFSNEHILKPWYDLGAAIGDAAFPLQQDRHTEVNLSAVVTAVRSLPKSSVEQIEVFRLLGALDASRPDAWDRFLKVLRSTNVVESSSPPKKPNFAVFSSLFGAILNDPRFAAIDVTQGYNPNGVDPTQVHPRIRVFENPPRVILDSESFTLRDKKLFLYVKLVVEANGGTIGPRHLKVAPYNLANPRPDKLHKRLKNLHPLVSNAIHIDHEGSRLKQAYVT